MKIYTTHRLRFIGQVLYIALGWIVVIALKPLSAALAANGMLLLFAGGVAYTVGVIFYLWDRLPYNHASLRPDPKCMPLLLHLLLCDTGPSLVLLFSEIITFFRIHYPWRQVFPCLITSILLMSPSRGTRRHTCPHSHSFIGLSFDVNPLAS